MANRKNKQKSIKKGTKYKNKSNLVVGGYQSKFSIRTELSLRAPLRVDFKVYTKDTG